MSPSQAVAVAINSVTAITAIVGTRVYNGNRPGTATVPCINFYEMPGGKKVNGFYRQAYSINCRAATAETALMLCRLVEDLFNGTSGTGTYGYLTNFEVTRACTRQMQGLIPEPEDGIYNAPIDIQFIFPSSSIS